MENNPNEISNFDQLMKKYLKDQKPILSEIDYKTPLKEISPIEPLIFKNEPLSMNNNNSKKINNFEPIYDNDNIESYNFKLNQNQNYNNNINNNYPPYMKNDLDLNENKFITPSKPINQKTAKSYINSSIEREKIAKEEKKKKQLEYQKMLDEQIKEKKERQRKEREKRLLEEKNFEEKFKLENEMYEQPIKPSNKKYRNISNIFSEDNENNNNNININNPNINNNNINNNNNNINEEPEYEPNYQNEINNNNNNNNRMIRRTKSQPHFEVMNQNLFQPINNINNQKFQNPPQYRELDLPQNSNSNPNLIQPPIPIEHLVSTSTQIPNQFLTPVNQNQNNNNNYLLPAYRTQNNYYPSSRQNKNLNINYNQNIQNPSQEINQYLTQRQYNEYHPPKLQQRISSDLGSNTNISISPSNYPTCYQMPFNNNLMNSSPNVNFNNNSQNVNELFNMNLNNMNNINNQNYIGKIIEMFFHEQEKILESYKETIEKLKNERDEAIYRNRANEQKILALQKTQKEQDLLAKNLGYFPFKNGYQQNLEKTLDSIMQKNEEEDYNNLNNNINNNNIQENFNNMNNTSNLSDSKLASLVASTKLVKVNNGDNKELLETWKKEEKDNKNKNNKIIQDLNYENNQKKKLQFNGMDTNSFMEKINLINNKILEPPEEPQKYLNANNFSLISKTQKNDDKSFANEISNINSNKETSNNNNSNNITTDIKITNNNNNTENDNIENTNNRDEISIYTKKNIDDDKDDIRKTESNNINKDISDINNNDIMLNNVHNIVMENLDNNISYSTQLKEKLEKEKKLQELNKLNNNNNNISEKEDKISKYTDVEKTKYQNYTFKQLNFSNSKHYEIKSDFNDINRIKVNPNLKNIDNNLTVSSKKNEKGKNPFDNIISNDDEEENIINTDNNNTTINKKESNKEKSEYIDEDINDMPNLDSPRNNDSQNFDIQRNTNIENKNEEASYYSTNRKEEDIINRLHFFDEDNLSPKITLEKKQSDINQKFNNINLELNDSTFKKNSELINNNNINNNDNIQNNNLNELSKRSIRPPTNLSLEKITSLNNLYDEFKKKKDTLNETNNSNMNNSLLKESLNTFTQNLNKKWKDLTNDEIKNIKNKRDKHYNEEVSNISNNNTTNNNNNTINVILENNNLEEFDKFEDEKIFDKVNQFTKVALNELKQSQLSVFSKEKTIKKYN